MSISSRRHFLTTLAGHRPDSRCADGCEGPAAYIRQSPDCDHARPGDGPQFPPLEDTHWDYEKGNLNQAAKDYAVNAGRPREETRRCDSHVRVGQVLEQENVDWLKEIAAEGHPIGNHTYDHVYLLAGDINEMQYRFGRPALVDRRPTRGRGAAREHRASQSGD